MKKIAILGLFTDANLGDPLICETVKKLYSKFEDDKVSWFDVDLRRYHLIIAKQKKYKLFWLAWLAVFYFMRSLSKYNVDLFHEIRIRFISFEFAQLLKGHDKAVIAGGGIIHYKFHDYYAGICAFILACQRLNVPCIINAVGVEGYNRKSSKCRMFAKYLSMPIVKIITTRDDIKTLKENYHCGKNQVVAKVIDPVVFCSKLFNVKIEPRKIVGIGIIRTTVLRDYMLELPLSHLLNFYAGLVIELEKRNIHYEFYTNGLSKDLDIMQGIEKKLNRKFNVRVPRTVDDFLSMIASFDGIICARMHSCIAAYSFGRPAVAFDWCEKVPSWFQNINEPSNCLPIDKLDPAYAVDKLLELKNRGYDEVLREKLEKQHIEILKYAIRLTS